MRALHFYPRSPRGERPPRLVSVLARHKFLSTLPARGATGQGGELPANQARFLSTLPARGATIGALPRRAGDPISIHAPREGSDAQQIMLSKKTYAISIHAPREGSDPLRRKRGVGGRHFYPRSPRGERLPSIVMGGMPPDFYPRSPRGERQTRAVTSTPRAAFLSTLPARGATPSVWPPWKLKTFLSTLPARGATLLLLLP